MNPDELIERIRAGNFTPDEIVRAAADVASADEDAAAAARKVVFAALEHYGAKTDQVNALLETIAREYAAMPAIVQFTRDARAAHEKVMNAVYQKIINPRSGEPCCPKCDSAEITEVGEAFEFTEMRCLACGHTELCDIYQVGDWYR